MTVARIPTQSDVSMTVTAPVEKCCPVRTETDTGTAVITWRAAGSTIELHDLAAYLQTFNGTFISHEDFTAEVAEYLQADVTTTWSTAGLEVRCAVLREPVRAEGA